MDRRLAWLVVAFGVLLVAGGAAGFARGSAASLASGGAIGAGLVAAGLLARRGLRPGPPIALALCLLTAVVMGWRLVASRSLVPALPTAVLAGALAAALAADRRRRAAAGRRSVRDDRAAP